LADTATRSGQVADNAVGDAETLGQRAPGKTAEVCGTGEGPDLLEVDQDAHVAALCNERCLLCHATVDDGLDDLDGTAAGLRGGTRDGGLVGSRCGDRGGTIEQPIQEFIEILGDEVSMAP
jgi:hypothetical protein